MIEVLRAAWSSSPRRTFVVVPLAATLFELLHRRSPLRGGTMGFAAMAAGYAIYRGSGRYRATRGGGGPGHAAEPVELVTTGPYAVVRNPMYLGHLIFLGGLVALTRSPVALAGLFLQGARFGERVAADERRLADRFGHRYVEYLESVPRWLPALRRSPYVLYHRIAEAESARIRLLVVQLGLKSRIDFRNAETDGSAELARLGTDVTPSLWDGKRLIRGADEVERRLARMTRRP